MYATTLIAPAWRDSECIYDKLHEDNYKCQDIIARGKKDPGRDENTDWFEVRIRSCHSSVHILTIILKGTKGEYELVVLHPNHFLAGRYHVAIKHPVTQNLACFYPSNDSLLREGSPTSPPLLPFCSRGGPTNSFSPKNILLYVTNHTNYSNSPCAS